MPFDVRSVCCDAMRSIGSRTIDGASMLRCMVVGLTAEQQVMCRNAIVPVEVVTRPNVREACASMSTVLPLVVVVDESMSESDRTTLAEMTTATGAEIVVLGRVPSAKIASTLLDALVVAERRRLGMRG